VTYWGSFVENFPLRYVDPTGHGGQEKNRGDDKEADDLPPDLPDWLLRLLSDPEFWTWLDDWLWDNVPSVIGVDAGVQLYFGFILEGEVYPVEFATVFNWRSGEISLIDSPGAGLYLGTPRLFGVAAYGGLLGIKGASQNKFLQGWSTYCGATASAEAFLGIGVSSTEGQAITLDAASGDPVTVMGHQVEFPAPMYQFIDPGSGRPITMRQDNLVVSFNAIPNTVDVGGVAGLNYTVLQTFRLPWWPLRR
jgi:hypothetical protein